MKNERLSDKLIAHSLRKKGKYTIRKNGEYLCTSLILYNSEFDEICDAIQKKLIDMKYGELIICNLNTGSLYDLGKLSLKIKNGMFMEFYDYNEMNVLFIRIYHFVDNEKTWVSVYIDENPSTPWWSKEEREKYVL